MLKSELLPIILLSVENGDMNRWHVSRAKPLLDLFPRQPSIILLVVCMPISLDGRLVVESLYMSFFSEYLLHSEMLLTTVLVVVHIDIISWQVDGGNLL